MTVRRVHLLSLVFAVLAPHVAGQGIRLPYQLPELEQRAQRDSNDAAVQYMLALGYWNAKRWDDAERTLRLAVQIEPRFAPGYLALAFLPFARHPELLKVKDPALVPDSLKAVLGESQRLQQRAFTIDPFVDLRIIGAVFPPGSLPLQSFIDGHYETANWIFGSLVNRYGADRVPLGVLWYAGLSAAHVNDFDAAVHDLQALLRRELVREQDSLVRVPLQANEIRYVLAIVKQRADDPSLLTDLGILLRQADSLNESESVLRASMDANPRDPRPPYYLGLTELQMGKADAARTAFQRFLAMAPTRDSAEIAEVQRYIVMLH